MFYAAYVVYAALTAWAAVRLLHTPALAARPGERYAAVAGMVAMPVAIAVVLTALLLNTNDAASKFVLWSAVPAAVVFLAGLYPSEALPASSRLALRLLGWGVLAGITLIPSSIALLAPVSALLALLVPERRASAVVEKAA